MQAIQMEFNIQDKTDAEIKHLIMQKQFDDLKESMRKQTKSLFAQLCELNKLYINDKIKIERLENELRKLKNEKTDWDYFQDEHLFIQKCG